MALSKEEFDALSEKVGKESADIIASKMAEAQKALDGKLEVANKANVNKEDLKKAEEAFEAKLKEVNEATAEALKALKAQGERLGELSLNVETKKNGKGVSFTEALENAFEVVKDELKDIISKNGKQDKPLIINVNKAPVTMSTVSTIGSGATQYTLTVDTGIVSPIRRREEKYLQAVSVGTISGNRALWIEETDEQGTPVFIAEGSAKIQLSSLWIEKTASVKKIGVYGKVTTELMDDLPQLLSYIKASLLKRLSIVVENQLLVGDNTGNNLAGAKTLATTFSAGANANAIDNANEFDVLEAVALQVEVANGIPNAVFIHPSTWARMKGLKGSDGHILWRDYLEPDGSVVYAGMKVITTTAVTAGEFIGGDMTVLHVLYRDSLTIQIGLDGNDFTNNLKTILVEQRLVQFASANDTPVIVKGVFATAKAALETA